MPTTYLISVPTVAILVVGGLGGWLAALATSPDPDPVTPPPPAPPAPDEAGRWPLRAPDPATIPAGPLGDAIRRGKLLVETTDEALPDHVGNRLQCTSCHLDGGTVPNAGPWVGVTAVFPEYRPRTGDVDTIEERVNDCFERSMDGTRLETDGPDMTAIVAYMTWLSTGVPTGAAVDGRGFARLDTAIVADPERGRALYGERCAICHGENGEGMVVLDDQQVIPPLWGDDSFNIGAGMARLDTAAAFVKWNMPFVERGTLTDQEAYDVAAYVIAQPRPDFPGKVRDWPNGGKPRDARY